MGGRGGRTAANGVGGRKQLVGWAGLARASRCGGASRPPQPPPAAAGCPRVQCGCPQQGTTAGEGGSPGACRPSADAANAPSVPAPPPALVPRAPQVHPAPPLGRRPPPTRAHLGGGRSRANRLCDAPSRGAGPLETLISGQKGLTTPEGGAEGRRGAGKPGLRGTPMREMWEWLACGASGAPLPW